eukprot:CAMPEP_0116841606 /NCGR_PEP_ID=MMETSP0418-20121206/11034_1 /TAXON_ID=1158023 /ORGANISM="Astrosyne radiata, Strain 13vi08-1A" /LENGTH=112 /DNA_ID=CAMNT_0004472083 /DNA_START=1 /DNA_END=336 /DNA_ORIENTATION=-
MSDYTAKLIDCGLAKFVADENSPMRVSIKPSQRMSSDGGVFGTRGYICPKYSDSHSFKFQAACDVFSLGVVLAELITGYLSMQPSTRKGGNNGESLYSFFIRPPEDEDEEGP